MAEQRASSFSVYPVGFRFCPTESELIVHYLLNKIQSKKLPSDDCVRETNIYDGKPEDIIIKLNLWKEKEWYFFTPRDRKYPNGTRPNRRAGAGYWRATGGFTKIKDENGEEVGTKRTLVYYEGEVPNGTKTNWSMHEYCARTEPVLKKSKRLDDWVLCKIHNKKINAEKKALNPLDRAAIAAAPIGQLKRKIHEVERTEILMEGTEPLHCCLPCLSLPGIFTSSVGGYGSTLQLDFQEGDHIPVISIDDNQMQKTNPLHYEMADYDSGNYSLNHDKHLANPSQLCQDQELPGNFSGRMGGSRLSEQLEFADGNYIPGISIDVNQNRGSLDYGMAHYDNWNCSYFPLYLTLPEFSSEIHRENNGSYHDKHLEYPSQLCQHQELLGNFSGGMGVEFRDGDYIPGISIDDNQMRGSLDYEMADYDSGNCSSAPLYLFFPEFSSEIHREHNGLNHDKHRENPSQLCQDQELPGNFSGNMGGFSFTQQLEFPDGDYILGFPIDDNQMQGTTHLGYEMAGPFYLTLPEFRSENYRENNGLNHNKHFENLYQLCQDHELPGKFSGSIGGLQFPDGDYIPGIPIDGNQMLGAEPKGFKMQDQDGGNYGCDPPHLSLPEFSRETQSGNNCLNRDKQLENSRLDQHSKV